MGGKVLLVLLFLSVFCQYAATAGYYFSSQGAFNNSCEVRVCSTCLTGQYKLGCANASLGVCTNCTRIPNATFTSHGWFNNSCGFACNTGFDQVGLSCSQVQMQYSVSFPASITLLNGTNQTFNVSTYINAVAALAGCAECGNARLSPIQCGSCSVFYNITTSIPVVYRRLLSSASVVTVDTTIVTGSKALADAAVVNINSNALNSKLAALNPNSGTASVTEAPTLTVQKVTLATPPPPPPPPPPTPSPATEGSNTGAIAGGVVGGVVGLGLVAVLVWYFTQKKPTQPIIPPTTPTPQLPPASIKSIFAFKQGGIGTPKLASRFVYVRKT